MTDVAPGEDTDGEDFAALVPVFVEHAACALDDPRRAELRDRLVVAYLPVARNIARRFSRRGEPTDDLEQVATVGLMHAVDRFDPGRERDFLSYAVPTIMGEVRRYFRDSAWSVRTPRSIKDRYLAVGGATAALSQRLGRAPTVPEIAEHLGLGRDEVAEAVAAHGSYHPASLDETLGEGDDSSLANILGTVDPEFDRVEVRSLVGSLVASLPPRERLMLALRFVHEQTQAEIAEVLCISQMHVSRLLTRTLAALRAQVEAEDRADGGDGPPLAV
ncbi:SigB/SigF/SigG family RNA polymerase sigma factor [Actinomycetospora endophytica]|uniref:SigB/SigF/SigG family RNA polymerase sigma factor n=1 Tax=Actinomycetospora endophytica TaxID=2291215 RepID=A0ABS8P6S7_9PSEU|nr:SigB/SigF/SigG family RNA polymerase sigma factor [Actinomycetospora endophytica]MCD2193952.1 SigB/SigF/SigG family RNA polymerase sigma factor [Actinomycetospora endophytica]